MPLPRKGQKYRHYKGGEYVIICLAIDEATGEPVVVYKDIHVPEKIWVRSLEIFMEEVIVDGVKKPRFSKLIQVTP